jgi:hypothetical protein
MRDSKKKLIASTARSRFSMKNKSDSESEKSRTENENLVLQRQEIEINLLVEDFKGRWQELQSLQNENNRWTTLYVTALLVVIGWLINHNGQKGGGLGDLYALADNSYLILSIAVVNALYAFSMAYKGYQIQQIALYQHEILVPRIRNFSPDFDEWERYRKSKFATWHGQDPIRLGYFILVKSLPLVVSYTIILLYYGYQWETEVGLHHWRSWRNWFCAGAFILVNSAVSFSLLTLRLGKRWTKLLDTEVGRDR